MECKIYRFAVLFEDAATLKELQNEQRVHVVTRLGNSLVIVWPSKQIYWIVFQKQCLPLIDIE